MNTEKNLKVWKDKLSEAIQVKNYLTESLKREKRILEESEHKIKNLSKAINIVNEVSSEIHNQVQFRICNLINRALRSIFPDFEYNFKLKMDVKYGKVGLSPILEDNEGNEYKPIEANGGGVADIVAFAFRISCLLLQPVNPRRVIIMDEPFKNVSEEYKRFVSTLLKELSIELNIQFIIVSHDKILIDGADKIFKVEKTNNVSKIREIK